MDKIICEVCGTAYPETSENCPICGSARSSTAVHAAGERNAEGAYTHVKGGRFSSSNVKKRNDDRGYIPESGKKDKKGSNFIAGIIAIIFLLILIGTLVFFIIKIVSEHDRLTQPETGATEYSEPEESLNPSASSEPSDTTSSTEDTEGTTAPSTEATTAPTETTAADNWSLNREDITLSKKGETWDLLSKSSKVSKTSITWSTDDEAVVKIENGVVEAVGNGKAYVYGEYEGVKKKCLIRCKFEDDSTQPTEPDGTVKEGYSISHEDVSLEVNESFTLRLTDPEGKTAEVTWKASKDGVVKIEGNKITALEAGSRATVSCTVEGKTFSCIVRVRK